MKKKTLISFTKKQIKQLDEVAKERNTSRSGLLRGIVDKYFQEMRNTNAVQYN